MKINSCNWLKLVFFFTLFTYNNLQGQSLVQSNFKSIILPKYMGSGSSARLPMVFRSTVTGLNPHSTYRYYNLMALKSDFATASPGAGNPMFMGSVFVYTSNPSLSSTGNYAEFTTDSSGCYTGWFCIVYTSNSRFIAGKYLYPTITLNNGLGGSAATARFALNDSVLVTAINTAAGAINTTGIYGNSLAAAKNIILLFDDVKGENRPLSSTYVESEDTTVGSSVAFYTTNVNSVNGAWGSLIPNNNSNGIRRIEQRSLINATLVGCATDDDGIWPTGKVSTVYPTGGTTALTVSINDAPLNDCLSNVEILADSTVNSIIPQGTKNVLLYKISICPNILGTILDSMKISIKGSIINTDICSNGIRIWHSRDAIFDSSDVLLDSSNTNLFSPILFKGRDTIQVHQRIYLLITADISPSAKPGDSLYIDHIPFANLFLSSGKKTGTDPMPQGGIKIISLLNHPQISVDTPAGFGKVVIFTTSKETYFNLKGDFLYPSSDSLSIIPPPGFEVSDQSGTGFSSSTLKVPYLSGKISTKIYARFKPAGFKTYSDMIFIKANSVSVTVPVSGVGISPDTIPPKVDTAYATDYSVVKVIFSEAVDSSSGISGNYTGLGVFLKITKNAGLDTVTLYLSKPLHAGVSETLTIKDISDTSNNHNKMNSPESFSIIYGTLPSIPLYKICQIKKTDSLGIADSNNVYCQLTGNVISLNYDASGYQFVLHDGTSGIWANKPGQVFQNYKKPAFGDKIKVTGTIRQFNGLIEIIPDSITRIDSNATIATPKTIIHLSDSLESELIRVNNLRLIDTNYFPWPKPKDPVMIVKAINGYDTFTIKIETECGLHGKSGGKPPTGLFDIIGIEWQDDSIAPFLSGYQIYPRFASDLIVHTTGFFTPDLKNLIQVYPNPCDDYIIIENNTGGRILLKIFNSVGQMMQVKYVTGKIVTLKPGLVPGLYFLNIENDAGKNLYFKKLVIN